MMDDDDRAAASRGVGKTGRRGGLGGPLLIIGLALLAFFQAVILYPTLLAPRRYEPERVADVNLPGRTIRVLLSRGDPQLLLKTPFDDATANRLDAEALDRSLFPAGERHRYYLLVASGKEGAFDPSGGPLLVCADGRRTFAPVDLRAALDVGKDRVPAWLDHSLRDLVPRPGPLMLETGRSLRVLLAYAEEAAPEALTQARLGDRVLEPAEIVKDALDRAIETASELPRPRLQ